SNGCGCAPPPKPCPAHCPAPTLQKPGCPSQACCKLPEVRQPCGTPCCPLDPKQVRRANRAVEQAQHEAAEACARQQRADDRAQRDQERAYERGTARIERANARLNRRVDQFAQAASNLENLGGPSEAIEEVKTEVQPEPQQVIILSKPEPETPIE